MPLILIALVVTVTFLNGFTDAPNSLANCVMTRCLPPKLAMLTGGACNLCGAALVPMFGGKVAATVKEITDLPVNSPRDSMAALCCSLLCVIILATVAWYFSVPTSESHALLAALAGASVAVGGKLSAAPWLSVAAGLVLSVAAGAVGGYLCCAAAEHFFGNKNAKKCNLTAKAIQIIFAAGSSTLHGLQDGAKLTALLSLGLPDSSMPNITVGAVMAVGTILGAGRIMKAVGEGFARLKPYQGAAADIAVTLALAMSTAFGMPVSTSNVKTAAVCGTAVRKSTKRVNWKSCFTMLTVWIATFPFCFFVSYILTHFIIGNNA